MKKILIALLLTPLLLNAVNVEDVYTQWCTKIQGILKGLDPATAKPQLVKVYTNLNQVADAGGGAIFVPVCTSIMPYFVKAKKPDPNTKESPLVQIKKVLDCPEFMCTYGITTLKVVAKKIPVLGGVLAAVLGIAENILYSTYRTSPALVDICVSSVQQACSKEIEFKGKKYPICSPKICDPNTVSDFKTKVLNQEPPQELSDDDLGDLL